MTILGRNDQNDVRCRADVGVSPYINLLATAQVGRIIYKGREVKCSLKQE